MQEDDYLPAVRSFIALEKTFEKPFAAGNAIAKQHNKPAPKAAGKSKAKAKAKAKAAA